MKKVVEKDPAFKELPSISPEESATGLLKVIEESTREKNGGEFLFQDGNKLAW